jgi:ATP-dependent DNA helicase DinG
MSYLDREKALALIKPGGVLSLNLKGFESRNQQQLMMSNVIDAYNKNAIALIEAGTGTGKSIAYLIPAILWAIQNKERTVFSTQTIALQEQLLHKDIPLVLQALNLDLKAVLVKGMRNYLCMRKLDEAMSELLLIPPNEAQELQQIAAWNDHTKEGSRSSLPFAPTYETWDRVCAENDTCNNTECSFYQQCHFFKARREANDAQLLIVNHHLLFADLAIRAEVNNYSDQALLPAYNRVVLDEAHHIEEVATEYFASKLSQLDMLRTIGRLAAEKQAKSVGKLTQFKEKIHEFYRDKEVPAEISSILGKLTIDLPGSRRDLLTHITETFDAFGAFVESLQAKEQEEKAPAEKKLRLLPFHQTHPLWTDEILAKAKLFAESVKRYIYSIETLDTEIKQSGNDKIIDHTKGIRFEILALTKRLTSACDVLTDFVTNHHPVNKVRWIEIQQLKAMINTQLVDANLDVSLALKEFLFSKFASVILCSATLTTNRQFDFVRQRLGLDQFQDKFITENIYDSPFNFKEQALFAVPTDIPDPQHASFLQVATEKIWEAIQASQGNAFVLFTSYSMLHACYQNLNAKLLQQRFVPMKQGESNRQTLLTKFKTTNRSVLFGTDSFWEGVDVVGEALRCVIIVKLPFKVPTEPIVQARAEAIAAEGGDPFRDYSLPQAIVKFKQGVGRLIRNKQDRGCIVCLDSRILTKNYGKLFLNSLPECDKIFTTSDQLLPAMKEFYRKTYYLVKKQ